MTGVGLKTQRTRGGQRTTVMTSVGRSHRGHKRSEGNHDDTSGAQPQGTRGGQRAVVESWSSSFTWVLGIELRLPSLPSKNQVHLAGFSFLFSLKEWCKVE